MTSKNKNICLFKNLLIAITLILPIGCCRYKTGLPIQSSNIQTIFVAPAINKAIASQAQASLTRQIREEIIRTGALHLESPSVADTTLTTTITNYGRSIGAVDEKDPDTARTLTLTMTAECSLLDNRTKEYLFKDKKFSHSLSITANDFAQSIEYQRLPQLAREVSKKIVFFITGLEIKQQTINNNTAYNIINTMNDDKIEWLPSILAANPLSLASAIEKIENSELKQVHIDVMDGNFVPNICMGPAIVKAIKQTSQLFLDVHLMLQHPENLIDTFVDSGANRITIHAELDQQSLQSSLEKLSNKNCKIGIAINPNTSVNVLNEIFGKWQIDRLIIMGVNPGFSGQKFIPNTLDKIVAANNTFPGKTICIDGGINEETAKLCRDKGANAFVIGASFFNN